MIGLSGRRSLPAALAVLVSVGAAGCGPRRLDLPIGAGAPLPEAATLYEEAVRDCRGARTIETTLALSGRAGDTRLRGNVDAGFEAPDRVRLEMRAPLGRPVFILVAPGPEATLYLPRDNRVLRGSRAAAVVEALVGLSVDGAELRALVSGCGFGAADPSDGRAFDGDWVAVTTGEATTYLRQTDGRWRVAAATRAGLSVQYTAFAGGRPTALRLRAPASKAEVSARLSDMNINVALHPGVFDLDVPDGAEPMTLDELRRAGPLGDQ